MNLLVVGSGGREHALAWALSLSPRAETVFVAPGNPGMALDEKIACTGVSAADFEGIHKLCLEKKIAFVVVGPDQALADGLVDFLAARGVRAYGPTKAAARIEASKAFSKELMKESGIPTARFETFGSLSAAEGFLASVEWGNGWVIKADGLALGKGVVVCERREEALAAVKDFFGGAFGEAGKCVVVEERLLGREVSAFSLCDGKQGVFLGFACDYKRIFDGDQGPNTGGMGAFSPADWLPKGMKEKIQERVVKPLLSALAGRGAPFRGTLFTGLMVNGEEFRVLEFNARFGDPETQALLPLLDEDLLPWLEAAEAGRLSELPTSGPRLKSKHAVHVVMASHGYPAPARKGDAISFPEELLKPSLERKLFFAGISGQGTSLATAGGRVLGLTALASSREEARSEAYRLLEGVKFSGAQRRNDVGR